MREEKKAAPVAPAQEAGEQPLPLLVRDIAADLSTTPIQVCKALADLGFGGHSVNMVVTPQMAKSLRAHFAATAQAAPAAVDGPIWEALHHAWMKIGADVAGLDWGAFTNAVHYAPTKAAPAAAPGVVRVCTECDIAGCRHLRAEGAKAALAGEYPPLPASYVGGTLLSAEPGITGCKVVLRFSNTDEAEVWFGALATRSAAPVAQGDAEDAARYRWLRRARVRVGHGDILVLMDDRQTCPGFRATKELLGDDLDAAIDAARAQAKEGGA